jgi:hypothetical protein
MCLVLGWGLVLMSCTSSGSDHKNTTALALSVNMPVAGLSATGSKSGTLTQPVAAVRGVTIEVAQ